MEFEYLSKDLESMRFATNYYKWILSLIREYLGNSTLEVGAGVGTFTEYILKTDVQDLTLIEPSSNLFPHLNNKFHNFSNVKTFNGYLKNYSLDNTSTFDSILYINVLEHVEKDREEIKLAINHLKPNRYLIIIVPALPRIFGTLDTDLGHYRRYTKKTLIEKVRIPELDIVKYGYMDFPGVFPWWFFYRFLKLRNLSVKSVKLYDRMIVPITRLAERFLPVPFGKNLFLVTKRKMS